VLSTAAAGRRYSSKHCSPQADDTFDTSRYRAAHLCAATPLPFLFGGDGSVVIVPPQVADASRLVLAGVRGFALRVCGMQLWVGMAPASPGGWSPVLRRCFGERQPAAYRW